MPTWNSQLEAGFVFRGVDTPPTDPSRSVHPDFATEFASQNAKMSLADKNEFTAALTNLYERSPTAARMIDAAVGWFGAMHE